MSSGFKKMWFKKGIVWEVIFILTILYAASSINVLVIVKSVLPPLHRVLNDVGLIGEDILSLNTHILTYFAEIALGLAVFLSIYHISVILHKPHHKTGKQEG